MYILTNKANREREKILDQEKLSSFTKEMWRGWGGGWGGWEAATAKWLDGPSDVLNMDDGSEKERTEEESDFGGVNYTFGLLHCHYLP